jgi:hypothetical protein
MLAAFQPNNNFFVDGDGGAWLVIGCAVAGAKAGPYATCLIRTATSVARQ